MNNRRALTQMSLGDVLDYSIAAYKRNFGKVTLLALIFYVPFTLIYSLIISGLSGEMFDLAGMMENPDTLNTAMFSIFGYYASLMVVSILYMIYSITLQPVMDAGITRVKYSDVVYGREEKLGPVFRESFKKFPRLFVNRLLYNLIIIGVSTLVVIVFYILLFIFIFSFMYTFTSSGMVLGTQSIIVSILLGIVALAFIAGLVFVMAYFAVKYIFGVQAIVTENKSGVGALSRSSELAKKCFWHAALSFLFGSLLFFSVPTMVTSLSYIMITVDKSLFMLLSIAGQVLSAVLYPYMVTLMTTIFISLKIKKEGLDLELEVDRLLEEEKQKNIYSNGEALNA